ncbi:hypothetical protein CXB51_020185 [Gossypium anomalum]|uniref:Zinc knuckle CX2CX4HX4C domain-containing protein n=1 Tax=Gossypium anomalum TaxID=47600 RepID=A0A8J6CW31_9ROSI|nr:hypothetical protein CXB51_020185 [Gossypium anomalum]
MFSGRCSYVRYKYERLTLFYFYCGRLGHSDSFCEFKMELGVEIVEMGWDLALRAQSRRAQAMNRVVEGISMGDNYRRNSGWGDINPILGFNLEGKKAQSRLGNDNPSFGQIHTAMEHDLENDVVIGEEGKKKARWDIEEINNMGGRNRIMSKVTHLLSTAANRQADWLQ